MEKLGRKRILLNDAQRRLLEAKVKALVRRTLMELTTIVTPDTILRWHRRLVAAKWDCSQRRVDIPGRPPVPKDVTRLVLRMAGENPTFGYVRIQGAPVNLATRSPTPLPKENGIEPAPERKSSNPWNPLLQAHWDFITAIGFTPVEPQHLSRTLYAIHEIRMSRPDDLPWPAVAEAGI